MSCMGEIIDNFEQGCFSAMLRVETGNVCGGCLCQGGTVVVRQSPFQESIGSEGKVGDGSVMTEVSRVRTRFFKDGCYNRQFERGGTIPEGGIYYVSDHGAGN